MPSNRDWYKQYYKDNPERYKIYRERAKAKLTIEEKERRRISQNLYQVNKRKEERLVCLAAYGSICKCCQESTNEFLCIDHINGGGTKHREEIGPQNMYKWLIKQRFPEGFQVLCHNCNMAKGFYGVCPHQAREKC